MPTVGFGEWCVLLAVILVVVGPKRLPAAARKFGNWYARFRRAADSFKRELMDLDTSYGQVDDETSRLVERAFTVPDDPQSADGTTAAGYEDGTDKES